MTTLHRLAGRLRRDERRRLVLHIGMGKAGTSALQVALVRNRERLAALGIDYPAHGTDDLARANGVTNGNGVAVADLLNSELAITARDLAEARPALRALCARVARGPYRTTVYSSELMYRFDPMHLHALAAEAQRAAIDLRVVAYVRDVAPYFLSSYSERVKRNRFAGSFEDYIAGADDFVRRARLFEPRLRRLMDAAGSSHVQVLHYDSARAELFPAFARDVLGVPDPRGWDAPPTVNRGLSAREFAVLRYLNAGCADAPWSGDVLISDAATGPSAGISLQSLEALEERFASEVAWINATFLGGRMDVKGDARIRGAEPDPPLSNAERAVLDRLIAAVRSSGSGAVPDRDRLVTEVRALLAEGIRV